MPWTSNRRWEQLHDLGTHLERDVNFGRRKHARYGRQARRQHCFNDLRSQVRRHQEIGARIHGELDLLNGANGTSTDEGVIAVHHTSLTQRGVNSWSRKCQLDRRRASLHESSNNVYGLSAVFGTHDSDQTGVVHSR
jgi:hypothetical protein